MSPSITVQNSSSGLVETRIRSADGDDLVVEQDASGRAIAERVEEDVVAQDAAVATIRPRV
jgi:hypothetical protein